jgi:hypothetical protein
MSVCVCNVVVAHTLSYPAQLATHRHPPSSPQNSDTCVHCTRAFSTLCDLQAVLIRFFSVKINIRLTGISKSFSIEIEYRDLPKIEMSARCSKDVTTHQHRPGARPGRPCPVPACSGQPLPGQRRFSPPLRNRIIQHEWAEVWAEGKTKSFIKTRVKDSIKPSVLVFRADGKIRGGV